MQQDLAGVRWVKLLPGLIVLTFAGIEILSLPSASYFLFHPGRDYAQATIAKSVVASIPAVLVLGIWLIFTAAKSSFRTSQFSLKSLFLAIAVLAALLAWGSFVMRADWQSW